MALLQKLRPLIKYIGFSKIFQYSYSGQGNQILHIFFSEDDQRKSTQTVSTVHLYIDISFVHNESKLFEIRIQYIIQS